MLQNKTTLILCKHSSATERFYPNTSQDRLIKCNECGVCYRITERVIRFYFESGKLSDAQCKALLEYIISEYPKLQKSGSPEPTPVFVDVKLANYIISRSGKRAS